jgi:hypothetical protein
MICFETIKQTVMAAVECEGGRDAEDCRRYLAGPIQTAVSHNMRT